MKQFGKILAFELKNYLKNKVFIGITMAMVVLIAVVMNIPRIVEVFEKEDTSVSENRPVMLVQTNHADQTDTIGQAFTLSFVDYEVRSTEDSLDAIQAQINAGEAECAFVIKDLTTYTYYVSNLTMYDMNTEIANEILQELYRMNAMVENGMTAEQAGQIMAVQIHSEISISSQGKNQMQNYFYTYIMIMALYMVILLYGQMVATNVATEKSSRAMEVLITSARPTSMMFGKVIASCLAGLIQLVAIFGSAVVLYQLNASQWGDNPIVESIFNIPPELLGYMLVFFVLGFFIYAFLFGAIGSTASKLEDINTSVMPLTFLFIIAFMVVIFSMSSGSVDNLAIVICSYVPFTSPMAMFTRIAMSTVPWYEIVISIVILIGSVIGVGVLSAKIYRVGVLLYGTTPKIGSIMKAIRKA